MGFAYLPVLLALLATLIGVVGHTWDEKASGWRRLTRTGRLTAGIALTSAFISIRDVRVAENAKRELIEHRAAVARIANRELVKVLDSFMRPFEHALVGVPLVVDDNQEWPPQGEGPPFKSWVPQVAIASASRIPSSIGLLDRWPGYDGGPTWAAEFQRCARECSQQIRYLLNTYRDAYDSRTIEHMDSLLTSISLHTLENLDAELTDLADLAKVAQLQGSQEPVPQMTVRMLIDESVLQLVDALYRDTAKVTVDPPVTGHE